MASVLVVAFAELAGNTRSNQISVAVLSLPFWVVTALCVRRLADARLPFAYAGAALCVAGAMLVISDPALKDDGLGSIDYIGIPLLLVGITSVLIAGSGSSHPDPEIDAPRADH